MPDLKQRLGAKVAIIIDDTALILRPSKIDKETAWHLPGGVRDDINESLRQTAIREIREETGITVTTDSLQLITFGEWTGHDQGDDVLFTNIFFTVSLDKQPAVNLSHEHDEYAWVTINELGDYDIKPEAKETIQKVLGGAL